jgi:hypothetical protein
LGVAPACRTDRDCIRDYFSADTIYRTRSDQFIFFLNIPAIVGRKGLHLRIPETLIMINFVALIKNGNMDNGKSGIWDSLSEEQKNEVLLSYAVSEMEENLIDENVVMEKYKF